MDWHTPQTPIGNTVCEFFSEFSVDNSKIRIQLEPGIKAKGVDTSAEVKCAICMCDGDATPDTTTTTTTTTTTLGREACPVI